MVLVGLVAILGPVKVSGSYSSRLGDLEGKLSYREVILKLSMAMLCHVEAICQILFGHVVGFASRNVLAPAGPRF